MQFRMTLTRPAAARFGLLSLLSMVVCAVGFVRLAQASPDARVSDAQIITDLRSYLQQQASKDAFSGAVLLAKGDEVLFTAAYGFANRAFDAPNKVDTKFNLGSMGKMFTAVSILQLVERGRLSLGSKLIEVVPDYPNPDIARQITIHQLLTHTAGLGNLFNEKFESLAKHKLDTIQAHLPLFVGEPLLFEPGTSWSYSNAGFIVLGLVIERVSGETYYDYVRRHIFTPAGMINTDNFAPRDDVPNLALGYTRRLGEGPPVTGPRKINTDFIHRGAASGGGYSTVEDLFRFARALLGHKLLNKEHTELMMTGKVATDRGGKYGFGMAETFIDGARVVGHSGGAPGINGQLDMYPERGYTVAVMTNYDGSARAVVERLRWQLSGRGLPQAIALSAAVLKAFAGTYVSESPAGVPPAMPTSPVSITADDQGLLVKVGAEAARRFLPLSTHEFFDEVNPGARLSFGKGGRARVDSVRATGLGPGPAFTARRVL
jgi:CubicO group peptidase (beta-lactamase class C family)